MNALYNKKLTSHGGIQQDQRHQRVRGMQNFDVIVR